MTNLEIIEQLENAIGLIKQDGKDWLDDRDIPMLEACIKALTALDKLRAELHATAELHDDGDYYLRDEWIDEYFDEYKAESEEV